MFCRYFRCGRWALARLDEVRSERKARCEGSAERTSVQVRRHQHYSKMNVPFFSYYNVIIVVMVVTFNNWFYICININHLAELVSLVQYFRTLKSLLTPCRFHSVNRLIFTHIGAS